MWRPLGSGYQSAPGLVVVIRIAAFPGERADRTNIGDNPFELKAVPGGQAR